MPSEKILAAKQLRVEVIITMIDRIHKEVVRLENRRDAVAIVENTITKLLSEGGLASARGATNDDDGSRHGLFSFMLFRLRIRFYQSGDRLSIGIFIPFSQESAEQSVAYTQLRSARNRSLLRQCWDCTHHASAYS